MVCEAACYALAEFATKLPHPLQENPTASYLYDSVMALQECLHDERWPVKDAASITSAKILRLYFLDQEELIADFLALYETGLEDCIWSVRENAAIAIAEVVAGALSAGGGAAQSVFLFDQDSNHSSSAVFVRKLLERCKELINRYLLLPLRELTNSKVEVNKSTSSNSSGGGGFSFLPKGMLITNSTFPGVAPPQNDVFHGLIHPNQSSSSGFRKGWGCCIDCVELRQAKPWEVTQGSLYLLREISLLHPNLLLESFVVSQDSRICPITAIASLLEDVQYPLFDKLHSAIYQEVSDVALV